MADNIVEATQSKMMILEQIIHMLGKYSLKKENEEISFDGNELKSYLEKGGDLAKPMIAKDYLVSDVVDNLRQKGIPCAVNRIEEGPGKGLCVLWVRDCDEKYVESAIEEIKASAAPTKDSFGVTIMPTTEVSRFTLNEMAKKEDKSVFAVYDLDKAESKVLTEILRTNNVTFSVKETKSGTDFFFTDKDKASMCMANMAVTFSDTAGFYRHFEVEVEVDETEKALNEVDKESDFVVVSALNLKNLININDNGMTHGIVRDDKFSHIYRSVDRDHKNFKLACKSEIMSMRHPVMLKRDEYERVRNDEKALKELINKKQVKPMFENEQERQTAYLEKEIKTSLEKRLYMDFKKENFDLLDERDKLRDVKLGDLSIAEYIAGDELSNSELYHIEDLVMQMSDDERKDMVSKLEAVLDIHEKSNKMFTVHHFTEAELERDIDETIEQAEIPGHLETNIEFEPMVSEPVEE